MLKRGRGRERHGETLVVWDGLRGIETEVTVCAPVFVDGSGAEPVLAERVSRPVIAGARGAADWLGEAGTLVEDKVTLMLLPDAPVCLVAGPFAKAAAVRRVSKAGDGVIRVVQPGQALAVGNDGESFAELAQRLAAPAGLSLCDLSDARVRFSLSGPEAGEIIATQSGADTHSATFKIGASAPTLFGHVPVQLTRTGADSFEIMAFSTYAQDLAQSLSRAIRLSC